MKSPEAGSRSRRAQRRSKLDLLVRQVGVCSVFCADSVAGWSVTTRILENSKTIRLCTFNTQLTKPKHSIANTNYVLAFYALALFSSPTGAQNVVKHSHPNNPAMIVENTPGPAKKNLQLNHAVGIKLKNSPQATGLNAFKTSSFPFRFSSSTTRPKCQLNAAEKSRNTEAIYPKPR